MMYFSNAYGAVAWLIVVSLAIGVVLVVLSLVLAVQNPDPEKVSAYECGFQAFRDTRDRFEVRFFLVAILFIVFDLEVSLLIPLGVVVQEVGAQGFTNAWIFVVMLTIGLVYEWRSSALEWE